MSMGATFGWTYNRHRTERSAAFVAHNWKVLVLARNPDSVRELSIGKTTLRYVLDEFLILLQCLNVARMIRKN